jgi:hypothetical protein
MPMRALLFLALLLPVGCLSKTPPVPTATRPATVACDHCGGTGMIQPVSRDGEEPEKTCPRCQGTGQVKS